MGVSVLVFLGYNIKVWGLPLVSVAILVALYTIGTVLVWYFHGPEDINKYLMTKLGGEPRTFLDGRPNVLDALINNASGILGRFMNVIMNVVFGLVVFHRSARLFGPGRLDGHKLKYELEARIRSHTADRPDPVVAALERQTQVLEAILRQLQQG